MNKYIFGVVVAVIIVIVFYLAFNKSKEVPLIPEPGPVPEIVEVDKQKQYVDMLTEKCYEDIGTEFERETECKG